MVNHRIKSNPNNIRPDLKALFTSADSRLIIDERRRRDTLDLLQKEIASKEVHLVNTKRKIWQNQLRYADRSMPGFHLLSCILMLALIVAMRLQKVDHEFVITSSMILAGVLGFLSILTVGRVCFAELAELSETCFFNVRQMTAFHMVFSGIINLAALSAGILFVSLQWKIQLIQAGLYILVPFVFTQCICLGILLTETGRRNVWLIAAVGVFLSVFYVILASNPQLYTESALFIWGIALAASSVLFAVQVKTLFTEIGKGEILCTNWN